MGRRWLFPHKGTWLGVLVAIAGRVAAAQELAVVRTFASQQEVAGLASAFELWNDLLPCAAATWVPVDLLLVYSQNFDLQPAALAAALDVRSSFLNGAAWSRCFRHVFIESANLSAQEDIYDSRGYAMRKDWVNGPNSVFRFILGSLLNGTFKGSYHSFYFMEIDAVPVRPYWLDQFILEATVYPRAAVRGSRYRGDSWDSFQSELANDLLLHINGNAIYNLQHPWLRWLYDRLEAEQATEFNAVAFDIRMANLSLEGRAGTDETAAVAWAEHVPADEDAYMADSLLVGNYANTLLNTSFDTGAYIRHGAVSNIFQNLNDTDVTLAAVSFDGSSGVFDRFNQSLGGTHPFRKIIVVSYGSHKVAPAGTTQVVPGEAGDAELTFYTGKKRQYKALCEAASHVTTEFFVFTDTYHIISGPVYILVNSEGSPVLPYIQRDSDYCRGRLECVKAIEQAEALFGIQLNYHHDMFETVFNTNATREFCHAWFDATLSLPAFKDCGFQYGPTADDYFAWQISVQMPLNYVPKDKERVGFRTFSTLWQPHPVDPRNCSVYTSTEYHQVLGNLSECALLGDQMSDCQASANCTFRPIFSSGRCVPTPRFSPAWLLPQAYGSTTMTNTSSSTSSFTSTISTTASSTTSATSATATSSTSITTSSSATATSTLTTSSSGTTSATTSTSISTSLSTTSTYTSTLSATSTSTTASSTSSSSATASTTTFSSTASTTTLTTSISSLTSSTSATSTITSSSSATSSTTISTSATSTVTTFTITATTVTQTTTTVTYTVLPGSCPAPILPSTVDITECLGLFPGDSCTVSCAFGYTGQPQTYTCEQSEVFSGTPPTCVATTTSVTITTTQTVLVMCEEGIPSGLGVDGAACVGLYNGEMCTASCIAPFEGSPVNLTCNPLLGQLEGPELQCKEKMCEVSQLPSNYSTQDCEQTKAGEFCVVACPVGYTGQDSLFECQADGTFTGSFPSCARTPCMPGGLPASAGLNVSSCMYLFAGESCTVDCAIGFEGASATYQCDMAGDFSGAAPTCSPKSCETPPQFFGSVRYNTTCSGMTHGQTCMTYCNQGYSGIPTTQRCFDGTLSGSPPSCSGNPCSFEGFQLGKGVNASTCFGLVTRETCTLSCLPGHDLQGSQLTLTCQPSGEFTATDAVCVPLQCGNLSSVTAFSATSVADSCNDGGSLLQFGEVCFAFCDQGYRLDSNATVLECQEAPSTSAGFVEQMAGGQTWNAEKSSGPTCTPRPCSRGVPNMRGTTSDCAGKRTGETCTISADLGFDISGNQTLTCQADGSFTKDMPTVAPAVCPTPTFLDGIGSTCDNKTVGADCWAYCNPGYEGRPKPYQCRVNQSAQAVLIEEMSDTINCTFNSSADDTNASSGRRLQTLASCGFASVAQVGLDAAPFFHDCIDKVHDAVCIAHCAQGWNMTEEEPAIFVCKNGFLVGAVLPTCVPLPCTYAFPDGLGIQHNCLGVRSAESCSATCTEAGYTYASGQSAQTWTCLPTGSLSGQIPTCERITCSDLSLSTQYSHNCQGKRFEDTCTVSCGPGFTLSGASEQYQCQADGNITGALPTCLGNPCANTLPNDPAFDTSSCDGRTTGQNCVVTCNPGFSPNSATLTCDTSGFLLGTLPSCKPMPCPDNETLADSSLTNTCRGITYGGTCAVLCAPGFILSAGSSVQEWSCMRSGAGVLFLSGTLPTCEPQACDSGLPVASPNMVDNCSALTTGMSCVQECATGYSSTAGTNTYTCTEDGSATSSSPPLCQPVQCASDLGTSPIVHTCAGITFGASCYAVCAPGYNSSQGPQQWDCAGSGHAQPAIPGLTSVDGIVLHGTLQDCAPQPCLYNLPFGVQYEHNCSNVKTGENCSVSCAAGFFGSAVSLQCEGNRGLTGTMPTCNTQTTTATSTTETITVPTSTLTTSTVIIAELPNLCLPELFPLIEGAGDFTCTAEEGVGKRCSSFCVEGGEAAITCGSDKRWLVSKACEDDATVQTVLVVVFGSIIAILCIVVLLITGYLCNQQNETYKVKVEPEEEMASAHPWDMDFFAADEALRKRTAESSSIVLESPTPAFSNQVEVEQWDEAVHAMGPPLLHTALTRPPRPEASDSWMLVDEDEAFRVWVQPCQPDIADEDLLFGAPKHAIAASEVETQPETDVHAAIADEVNEETTVQVFVQPPPAETEDEAEEPQTVNVAVDSNEQPNAVMESPTILADNDASHAGTNEGPRCS